MILDNILTECISENIIEDYTYGIPLADAFTKIAYANRDRVVIRNKGVLLLKPHGSLNLVHCSSHKQATYGEGFFYLKDSFNVIDSNGIKCPSCGYKTKPLIIPPLYNKKDYVEDTKPKSQRIAWRSTPENYRKHVDRRANEILRNADEIIVIGYSLPAYDYDFKSLLITNLMFNKKRKDVHLKIITKGDEHQLKALKDQYKYLVGTVTIEGSNGFYSYLKSIS